MPQTRQTMEYVAEGRTIVVDLEKSFARVNHDILMARLTALSGKRWRGLSACPAAHAAMNQPWIESLALESLLLRYDGY